MWTRLTSLFKRKQNKRLVSWTDLSPGSFIRVYLKAPDQIGIIAKDGQSLTYQRLDAQDLETKILEGFVTKTYFTGRKPYLVEYLEIDVVKRRGLGTRLISYLLLREEIEHIEHIENLGDKK